MILEKMNGLRERIADVMRAAQQVDLGSCEEQPIRILLDDRRPRIHSLLADGVRVATVAERLPDSIGDVAPLVRIELESRMERVGALDGFHVAWEIGAELASAQRRVLRSMTALEAAAANDCGEAPRYSLAEATEASLRARKMLTLFRKKLVAIGEPSDRELTAGVRAAGQELARLICSESFAELRVHDRVQARALQKRIMSWLRDDESEQQRRDGRRLLESVAAFAALTGAVNQREELVHHDLSLMERAERELNALPIVPPIWRHQLRALEGRNEELDDLLTREGALGVSDLLAALANVRLILPGST